MKYTVEYTPQAVGALKELTPQAASLIYSWTEKNLNGCEDPRAQGKGKKRGGRWRYKVGAYRLVCEIQGSRIIVLAVTTGAEAVARDHRGQAKRRTPSVFLKSTTRQPVKTAALLIVTALLTFAFVSRGAEYLLIDQEVERLEGFYEASGGIQEVGYRRPWNSIEKQKGKDASEVIQYLKESPYVDRVDVRQDISGVLPDFQQSYGFHVSYANPIPTYSEDVLFYGTLQKVGKMTSTTGRLAGDYQFSFMVDEVIVGIDSMLKEGELVSLINPRDNTRWTEGEFLKGAEILQEDYLDMTDVASGMEVGKRYLLRSSLDESQNGVIQGGITEITVNGETTQTRTTPSLQFKTLTPNGPWYIQVAEGEEADFSDPRLAGLLEEMQLYDDNQHSRWVGATSDMTTMITSPEYKEMQVHLLDGRWLTAEDAELKRPVCVVYEEGIAGDTVKVGDTVTMKLRDIPLADFDYDNYAERVQLYVANAYGFLFQEDDLARLDEIEETSVTIDFEVVGVFGTTDDPNIYSCINIPYIYIPSSFIPETFTHYQAIPEAGQVSFSLTGPDVLTAFLEESEEALAALGFQLKLPDNGWENFQAATIPVKQSSLYNALVFAGVMAAGLAIVVVVYFYMRRKELPIARAIGVPARTCVRQVMTPLLVFAGIPGIALGAAFGWLYTARNAGKTLSALAEFGTIDPQALPLRHLAVMAGISFALLLAMALFGAVMLVRRPVLELLQGAARAAVAEVSSGKAEPISPVLTERERAATLILGRPATVRKEKLGLRAGLVARFVWRQAARARLKTVLTIVLAAGFTIGLAAIQLAIVSSQERIDWLIENTPVEAELIRTGTYRGSSIRRDTVEALRDTGYISDFYLEASTAGTASGCFPYREDWNAHGVNVKINEADSRGILAFEDERSFLAGYGSGAYVDITYHDGWNGAMFAGEYTGRYDNETDERFPVVVPKDLYDTYELEPGDSILVFSRTVRPFEVAGYYEGVVAGDGVGALLMPLSAAQTVCSGRISYSKAHVTLDPSLNRQIDILEAALEEITSRQGIATLRAVIWDEELRQAVAPLEGGIRLMRVLYPVMLVLSLLCAAGISVLFIMTSAKEAAILRIQGTTQLRTQVIMGLQQTLTCFVGLIVGLASVLLYVGSARPALLTGIAASSVLCAAAYLVAATVGAVASSVVVTSKNPLELLQVKE